MTALQQNQTCRNEGNNKKYLFVEHITMLMVAINPKIRSYKYSNPTLHLLIPAGSFSFVMKLLFLEQNEVQWHPFTKQSLHVKKLTNCPIRE